MTRDSIDERMVWLLRTGCSLMLLREMERLLVGALDAFVELTVAERGYFYVTDTSGKNLVVGAARGAGKLSAPAPEPHVGELVRQVAGARESIIASDSAPRGLKTATKGASHVFMCVPVVFRRELLGVLYADTTRQTPGIQARHLDYFAELAAVALDTTRLLERAHNDLLTGLPNQESFLAHLQRARLEAIQDKAGGVLLIDLDNFRRVNQAAGTEIGDKALQDVAQTLRDALCADGVIARYGADKFAILLMPKETKHIHLRLLDVAERARAVVGAKTYHAINLTSSIGGVSFTVNSEVGAAEVVGKLQKTLLRARRRDAGNIEIALHTASEPSV